MPFISSRKLTIGVLTLGVLLYVIAIGVRNTMTQVSEGNARVWVPPAPAAVHSYNVNKNVNTKQDKENPSGGLQSNGGSRDEAERANSGSDSGAQNKASSPSQTQSNAKVVNRPVKLLLLGYKRGGTSFVTSLLHSHREVFMVYEPVWYVNDPDIYGYAVMDKEVPLRSRTKDRWKAKPVIPDPLEYISDWANCKVTRLNFEFIMYDGGSRDTAEVRGCAKKSPRTSDQCFKTSSVKCQKKEMVVQKTVRLSMEEAKTLMERDPDFHVLYLARDPRGNRNSYEQTAMKSDVDSPKPPYSGVSLLKRRCDIMNKDAVTLIELSSRFRDQLLVMRYEDIAENPLTFATKLFEHFNMNVTPEVKAGIQKLTSNKGAKEALFSTIRKDSSSTANKWREVLHFGTAQTLQKECSSYFEVLKYTPFSFEQDMRNYTLPYRESLGTSGLVTL